MKLWGSIIAELRRLSADRCGQFAMVLGIVSPIALGLIGGGVDMMVFLHHRSELQATADSAVLAVAREASIKGWSQETAEQVAAAVVQNSLSNKFGVEYDFRLSIDQQARRIDIDLDQDHYGYFVIGYFAGSPQITVSAAAFASGVSTICIIAQSPSMHDALVVNGKSKVRAEGCAAYSNSTSTKGVNVKDLSMLRTLMACTAGGFGGKLVNYNPVPLTDCPPIPDPLVARAKMIDAALTTGCDHNKLKIAGGTHMLTPGTYCGGLTISDGAEVELETGVYVIQDGQLNVDKAARLSGLGVGLVFTGKKAELALSNDSSVSLSAPESGLMAGILIYGQPSGKQRKFSIISKDAQKFTGTVYLPADTLTIGGDNDLDGSCDPVKLPDGTLQPPGPSCISDLGTESDWTAIIAKQLKVTGGSTLVMNSNYDDSKVPVPAGIGPTSGRVILAQ